MYKKDYWSAQPQLEKLPLYKWSNLKKKSKILKLFGFQGGGIMKYSVNHRGGKFFFMSFSEIRVLLSDTGL